MRKKLSSIFTIFMFLVGLAVLMYPTVSNYINQKEATRAVVAYDNIFKNIKDGEYGEILGKAREYNQMLAHNKREYINGKSIDEVYEKLLNINDTGIMGYITIPKIKVKLPIYHGTAKETLDKYAGHLEGSSLPVGGENTHSIIVAHRGLPGAKLFTDLDKIKKNDTFTITVMDMNMTYIVDKISTVEPQDVSKLNIEKGEDYVTLVTCTPYAVNTHRLLVRGKRQENEKKKVTDIEKNKAEKIKAKKNKVEKTIIVCITAVSAIFIILFILFRCLRKKSIIMHIKIKKKQ